MAAGRMDRVGPPAIPEGRAPGRHFPATRRSPRKGRVLTHDPCHPRRTGKTLRHGRRGRWRIARAPAGRDDLRARPGRLGQDDSRPPRDGSRNARRWRDLFRRQDGPVAACPRAQGGHGLRRPGALAGADGPRQRRLSLESPEVEPSGPASSGRRRHSAHCGSTVWPAVVPTS